MALIVVALALLVVIILLIGSVDDWWHRKPPPAPPSSVSYNIDEGYLHFFTNDDNNTVTFSANEFLMVLVALTRRWGVLDITYRDVLLANWHFDGHDILGDPGIIVVKEADSPWGNISIRDCTYSGDVAAAMENMAKLIEEEDPR